ncbi:MAG: hypothetical protein JWN23_1535 [Rhodocyclales bacterium]|nr:hypothetical protein [Rhodocyclales bacterium]
MDWLGALGAGLEGFHEGQRRDIAEKRTDNINAQDAYARNRAFERQKRADAITDSPLDAVQPAQQAGGTGGTGGAGNPNTAGATGGTQPTPSLGLSDAQAAGVTPSAAPVPQGTPAPNTQQAPASSGDPYVNQQTTIMNGLKNKAAMALQSNLIPEADTYMKQADGLRSGIIQRLTQRGLQQYSMNGDLNNLLPAANAVFDGTKYAGAQTAPDGTVTIQRTQFGKPADPLVFAPKKGADGSVLSGQQQALQALRDYTDPASAAQRAQQTWDMLRSVQQKNLEAIGAAQAENMKNKDVRAGGSVIGPNGQVLGTAPNPPEFGTMKNPGENGGDSLYNKNTGQLAPGPAGTPGSGGDVYKRVDNIFGKPSDTNTYDPAYAAFTVKQLMAQNPGVDPQVVDVAARTAVNDPSKLVIRADRQSGQLGVYVDAGAAGALRVGDLSQAKQLLVGKDDKTGRTAPLSQTDLTNTLTTGSQTAKQQWLDDLKAASPAIYSSATTLTPSDIQALRTGKGTVAASDGTAVDIAQVPAALRQQILTANQYVGDTAKAASAPAAAKSTIKKMADTAQARTDARQAANIEASPLDLVRAKVGNVGNTASAVSAKNLSDVDTARAASALDQLDSMLPWFKQGKVVPSYVADAVQRTYANGGQAARERIKASLTPAQLSALDLK